MLKKVLLLAVLLAAIIVTYQYAELRVSRGPYLQLANHEGVTVVWRTNRAMADPRVVVRAADGSVAAVSEGSMVTRRSSDGEEALSAVAPGGWQYEAKVTGLRAGTDYDYVIHDGDDELYADAAHCHIATYPEPGISAPARIWVVGDSGTGDEPQQLVYEAAQRFCEAQDHDIDLCLHLGDMAYGKGTDREFQVKFFRPYAEMLKDTVCWPAFGNHENKTSDGKHEVGPYFDAYVCPTKGEAGGVPSGHESFYSFDYGDIHFICLNSCDVDRSSRGEMADWLKRDLAAAQAHWIVAFWHHPPYSKGSHDGDRDVEMVEMREAIMPILEDGGVDLVLGGHSHLYERSMLIDGAYATPATAEGVVLDDGDGQPGGDGSYLKSATRTPHNGTVAVVAGHGGSLSRNLKGVDPLMRKIVQDHGSLILDIDGDTLTGTMLDLHGKTRDRFEIRKSGVVERHVVERPWKPSEATVERTGAIFDEHDH